MNKKVFILTIVMTFVLPLTAFCSDRQSYLSIGSGLYIFRGGLQEATFDTGFDGEILYGHYIFPNLVLEAGTGYFHDGVNKGYGNDLKGVPVRLTAKGIYPLKNFDLYAGGGIGVYFMKFHGMVNGTVADANDTVFGGHLAAGTNYNLSSSLFVGLEGKYIFTEKADLKIFTPRLSGYTVTGNFGFRF